MRQRIRVPVDDLSQQQEDVFCLLSCRRTAKATGIIAVLGFCLAGMTLLLGPRAQQWRHPKRPLASIEGSVAINVELQDSAYCGDMDDNVDYAAFNLYHIRNITNSTTCCLKCQQDPSCRAWTWGKARGVYGLSDVCYLKGLTPGESVMKMPNENTTSGLPFRVAKEGEVSLFCFSPVTDGEAASDLIVFQYTKGAGIFSCEEYAIYGSGPLQLVPSLKPSIVRVGESPCPFASDQAACTRAAVEMAVWKQVAAGGRFRFHRWTVKVDTDTVFFPSRLRRVLKDVEEPEDGVYFNNCQGGLRTPLTVLSRIAVQVYALGYPRCEEEVNKSSSLEVVTIHQCLSSVLQVQRRTNLGLLSDTDCTTHDMTCTSNFAAFYPFTSVDDYNDCLAAAKWEPTS